MAALHSEPLDPGQWWACSEPERPWDENVAYDDECPRRCLVSARLHLVQAGDMDLLTTTNGVEADEGFRLSDLASGQYLPRATRLAAGIEG